MCSRSTFESVSITSSVVSRLFESNVPLIRFRSATALKLRTECWARVAAAATM